MLQHIIVGTILRHFIVIQIVVGQYSSRYKKLQDRTNIILLMPIGGIIWRPVLTAYGRHIDYLAYNLTITHPRWFKGEHTHGTIMPRLSSLHDKKNLSHGFAFTVPKRSYEKAKELKFLRRSYPQLQGIWLKPYTGCL